MKFLSALCGSVLLRASRHIGQQLSELQLYVKCNESNRPPHVIPHQRKAPSPNDNASCKTSVE